MPQALAQSKPSRQLGGDRRADTWRAIAVCGFLVLSVFLVFGRTLWYPFLNWDDFLFVNHEPHVVDGLTSSGIVWAFTDGPLGEWYPLSMLSHMADCQIFGLHPAGHHLTNLLLHAAAAVTLFLVLWRMTAQLWASALVAALFAVHPLHVESVAWIAERRDVLSGLFFMLTLAAYVQYVRHPYSLPRYLSVAGFFTLGLLAKPMMVTLPPLLLLLDYWPLGRIGGARPDVAARTPRSPPFPWRVVWEKLPLMAIAIGVAVVTMRTHSGQSNPLTMPERLANAAVSCVAYLGQLFVPVGLSPFYSHPEAGWPTWQVAGCVALLLAITAAAIVGRRTCPYLLVGWFWYLGVLVPVLGLTFVGAHARADRYTYLSQIGLYIALVWGVMRLAQSWPARRWVLPIGAAVMLAALMACSWRQSGFWSDDQTVWRRALACDPTNVTAHSHLAAALLENDEPAAVEHLQQALDMGPHRQKIYSLIRAGAHDRLGSIAVAKGDSATALAEFHEALEAEPNYMSTHANLGGLLAKGGDVAQGEQYFRKAIKLGPNVAASYFNLAMLLSGKGDIDGAIANYRKGLKLESQNALSHSNLAMLLLQRNKNDEALTHFLDAIRYDPAMALPYFQAAALLRQQGKTKEAAGYDERGTKASLDYAKAQDQKGLDLIAQGKTSEAIAQFEIALAVYPDFAQAHSNLADALAAQGNIDDAILHYRRALEIDPNLAAAQRGLSQLAHPQAAAQRESIGYSSRIGRRDWPRPAQA